MERELERFFLKLRTFWKDALRVINALRVLGEGYAELRPKLQQHCSEADRDDFDVTLDQVSDAGLEYCLRLHRMMVSSRRAQRAFDESQRALDRPGLRLLFRQELQRTDNFLRSVAPPAGTTAALTARELNTTADNCTRGMALIEEVLLVPQRHPRALGRGAWEPRC